MKTDTEILDWLDQKAREGQDISLHGSDLLVGRRYVGFPLGHPDKPPTFRELVTHAMEGRPLA